MMDEGDLPRPKGDAASKLAAEDLDPYSQEELAQRITVLKHEIARVEEHMSAAERHRSAADALFGRKD